MFHRPKPYGDTPSENEKPTTEAKETEATQGKDTENSTGSTTAETKPNPFAASTPADNTATNSPFRSTSSASTDSDTKTTSSSSSLFSSGKDTSAMTDQDKTNETEATDASKKPLDIPAGNNPFQRPQGNTTGAPTGSQQAPGSYGTYSPAPYASSTPQMGTPAAGMSSGLGSSAHGRRLVIGEGITMSGEIEACDHLLVEGTVEAALKGAKVLEISAAGTFYGTVEIENATIAGRFEGDITISGRLTVKNTGSVTGTISYGELAIEAGATLDGTLTPLNATAASGGRKGKKTGNDAELPLSRRASGE